MRCPSKTEWLILLAMVVWSGSAAAAETWQEMYNEAGELAHSGHHEEAVAAYSSLLEQFPDDPDALLGRGRVQAWLGNFPEAETDLLQVVKDHPDYADAWSALADLYRW